MAQSRVKKLTIKNGCDKKPGSKCGVQVYFLPADKPLVQVSSKK
jgi:hypothetical protein